MTALAETNGKAPSADLGEISRALDLFRGNGVVELRHIKPGWKGRKEIASGYFDNFDRLAAHAGSCREGHVYLTLNPVNPDLLSRRANRVDQVGDADTTSDKHVMHRRMLLVDLDAKRVSGVSASDEEHELALDRARTIADALKAHHGFPEPVLADSGNGGHLLYRIDLPNDEAAEQLVRRVLAMLADLFDDDRVTVDQTVSNAARISKLYGTVACKGDHTHDRPHRLSKVLFVPDPWEVLDRQTLIEFVGPPPEPKVPMPRTSTNNGAFDLESFLARNVEVVKDAPYTGKPGAVHKYELRTCPLCGESDGSAVVMQFDDGHLAYRCHHDRCTGRGWRDLREHFDPGYRDAWRDDACKAYERRGMEDLRPAEEREQPKAPAIDKFTFRDLVRNYPTLRAAIVEGLFREGETVNFISHAKAGKSWLAYQLALSIVDYHYFLGAFPTARGRVLLVDNELHRETLAFRIPKVAEAMGVPPGMWEDNLEVWPLRGRLRSLADLAAEFEGVDHGAYKVIIFDAKYRFVVQGASENDNASEAQFYNLIDQIAEKTGAAVVLVHHTSKGSQSDKKVTDVGSGAGAMSRAADCHLVLREHEQEGCAVLEAALRSFAPMDPLALRWEFPAWRKASDLDATQLKGRKTRQQENREALDRQDKLAIVAAMRDAGGRQTNKTLRKLVGMSREKLSRLLDKLEAEGQILSETTTKRGNSCDEFWLPSDSEN